MANACIQTKYFSGQGALLLATRSAGGAPEGFRPVGNVTALSIGIETTVFQHKESCTGVRAVDLEIVQELNGSMTFTMESLDRENLAVALYGTSNAITGASVTDETHTAYHDLWTGLDYIKVSAVSVTGSGGTPTYVENTDYEVNAEAGTIKVLSTGSITDLATIEVDYTYAAQDNVEAATSGSAPVRWARFEGLNTADTDKPVVVNVFKASVQPLAELALINDELSQMEVESRILSDALRTSGSKYFNIKKVA